MNVKCLIIDDEPLAHDIICSYSEDVPFLQICGQCYRATEAFEFLTHTHVDLIFLDIRMPKLSGLDFLRTFQNKPLVIITSAYEEYALESFDLAVCDYLLKPIRFERFLQAVNRAVEVKTKGIGDRNAQLDEQISVKVDKKYVLVSAKDIQYLESLGNYVKVWRGTDFLLTPRTLSGFEEQLPPSHFIRIHKSFILNRMYVHFLEGNTIYLKDGRQLPVGKSYQSTIKTQLDIV